MQKTNTNAPTRSFRELIVWQKAHQFVLELYRFTRVFPAEERFGLTLQIRRAGVSVTANIAGGFPKRSASDNTRFFNIAQGSLEEAHYYLILAEDLGCGNAAKLLELYGAIGRLLNGCITAIPTPGS